MPASISRNKLIVYFELKINFTFEFLSRQIIIKQISLKKGFWSLFSTRLLFVHSHEFVLFFIDLLFYKNCFMRHNIIVNMMQFSIALENK